MVRVKCRVMVRVRCRVMVSVRDRVRVRFRVRSRVRMRVRLRVRVRCVLCRCISFNFPFDYPFAVVEESASFKFPDPGGSPDGLEPNNKQRFKIKPQQDRYGHSVEPTTPEKEKQRKGRFSAQSAGRSKRCKNK